MVQCTEIASIPFLKSFEEALPLQNYCEENLDQGTMKYQVKNKDG